MIDIYSQNGKLTKLKKKKTIKFKIVSNIRVISRDDAGAK